MLISSKCFFIKYIEHNGWRLIYFKFVIVLFFSFFFKERMHSFRRLLESISRTVQCSQLLIAYQRLLIVTKLS